MANDKLGNQSLMSLGSLELEDAKEVIEAMLKYASEEKPGRGMALAVVDAAGVLVSFARMDGASSLNAKMAINKAFTAIEWRRDTKEIRKLLFDFSISPEKRRDIAWFGVSSYSPIPGGTLLKTEDGAIVGAVGTSGRIADAPGGDLDIAEVGAKAYQEILRRKKEV